MHSSVMDTERAQDELQGHLLAVAIPVRMPSVQLRAASWVRTAIALGFDPQVRQDGLAGEDPGEWKITTRKAEDGAGLMPPEELWDDIFAQLIKLDRMQFTAVLQVFHGNFLLDDCTARAIGLRLKAARLASGMKRDEFYDICGLESIAADALEDSAVPVVVSIAEIAGLISRRHNISEEWLSFGVASDIEPSS